LRQQVSPWSHLPPKTVSSSHSDQPYRKSSARWPPWTPIVGFCARGRIGGIGPSILRRGDRSRVNARWRSPGLFRGPRGCLLRLKVDRCRLVFG
jgi:hypothetical protein